MSVRVIPNAENGLIGLSTQCVAGAIALGVELNLQTNDAASVSADHYDYVGAPGTDPATAGKRGQLNLKRQAVQAAQAVRRNAINAGRTYNERALDHLKGYLGRRWNNRWVGTGFTSGSLALPYDPKSLLLEFRAYFALNAAHESASNGVTAAQANILAAAIDAALLAESQASTARNVAVEARDESFQRLRMRIVGLRHELEQILEPDDMRWRTFGFARPVDRRIPKPVAGLTVRQGTVAGEIIVEWPAASGAENYRVTRLVQTVETEPVDVGLFTDRTVIIRDLPSGKTVIVSVTARNPAGETLPTNSTILVA
jgi:hypothetical protein